MDNPNYTTEHRKGQHLLNEAGKENNYGKTEKKGGDKLPKKKRSLQSKRFANDTDQSLPHEYVDIEPKKKGISV